MRLRHAVLVLLAGVIGASAARADDISDQIDKAGAAWRAHDSQAAITALEAAANLLRQARADMLKTLLPLPPPGWTADTAETSSVSAAMLGGGTSASRIYHNGAQRVEVQITTDSPMLQGMAALISSPLASASGVKTVMIGGRAVSYTESDNGYMTLVGNKVIVKVDGSKDTPETTLRSFVASIDFDAVEKLAH
jgi:ATP/maltotriose-dependent transcriptional regulator MalT